jgi:predicted amidophosphoribosyltransferase
MSNKDRFVDDPVAKRLISSLYANVGAFFHNALRVGPRICSLCAGPATMASGLPICAQCRSARNMYGNSLADLVVPLAYAQGWMPSMHQSAHHVRAYKAQPPAPKCVQDLEFMTGTAAYLHGRCIAATVGMWQVVTFVSSAKRPGAAHPVAGLAQKVHNVYPSTTRLLLDIGPEFDAPPVRAPRPDRFVVPIAHRPLVAGKHVLVVDDTWVSGDKAQSAALTLKAAGARCVTILCVTRWLRYDWDDHRELIDTLTEPYDAARCPVTGSSCPD